MSARCQVNDPKQNSFNYAKQVYKLYLIQVGGDFYGPSPRGKEIICITSLRVRSHATVAFWFAIIFFVYRYQYSLGVKGMEVKFIANVKE